MSASKGRDVKADFMLNIIVAVIIVIVNVIIIILCVLYIHLIASTLQGLCPLQE